MPGELIVNRRLTVFLSAALAVSLIGVLLLAQGPVAAAGLLLTTTPSSTPTEPPDETASQTPTGDVIILELETDTPTPGSIPPAGQGVSPTPGVATPTPIALIDIVIAVQDIPRGFRIPPEAVSVRPWPIEAAPFNAITDPADVIGKIARTDIYREQPIMFNMVLDEDADLYAGLAQVGSDAAAILPAQHVGITIYLPAENVPLGATTGDQVDLIHTVPIRGTDQSVTQRTVENALLIQVGAFPAEGVLSGETTRGPRGALYVQKSLMNEVGDCQALLARLLDKPLSELERTWNEYLPETIFYVGEIDASTEAANRDRLRDIRGITPDNSLISTRTTGQPTDRVAVTLGVQLQDAVYIAWAAEAGYPVTMTFRAASATALRVPEPATYEGFVERYGFRSLMPPATPTPGN